MSLRELYQEMIVDHGKHPRNVGKLEQATHCQVGHNPLCGDKLCLYVTERDGKVEQVQFEGSGCAISVASASLMTEAVKGKTIDDVRAMFTSFHQLVTEGKEPTENLGKLAIFAGVMEYPARVKCATLAWHTLNAALNNDLREVCTE
jgi:nitrogen fixation NifU-like protein